MLLSFACEKVSLALSIISGRFTYLECEDKPRLVEFYNRNGFRKFDIRKLDRDELEDIDGKYLVQMIKYI